MILALDIGNTNITMGVFDGRDLKFVSRLATDRQRTEDQYAVELRDIVDIYGVSISEIEGSIISSVVPSLTSGIKRAVKRLTRTEPLCIGPGMKTGLNIKLNDPSTLGADLVAGAVAAMVAAILEAGVMVQAGVFIVVSALALALTRPLVRRWTKTRTVATNADRVLGQTAKVTEAVDNDNSMGAVYVDGKTWSARSSDGSVIPVGTRVQVERMEGVKLFVRVCEKKEETAV